jgi:outer membrane receptor protein involved in Fe transport
MNSPFPTTPRRLVAALLVLWAALGPARPGAREDEPGGAPTSRDEQDLRDLLAAPVEAASKIPQSVLEAPSVVSAVSRRTVESYGWSSLNDMLYLQPGFFPSRQFERWTVGARGLFEPWNNDHILVLVDGVPFADAENASAYTWDLTPIFPWRSIEVVRGPGSALFGSGAMNGVVALSTPSALRQAEREIYAAVRLGNDNRRIYEGAVAEDAKIAAAYVAVSHNGTDGNNYTDYDGSGRRDPDGALARFPVRDRHDSTYLLAKVEAKGALEGLSLQYHHHDWAYQADHGYLYMSPATNDDARESREMVVLHWQKPGSPPVGEDVVLRLQRHEMNLRLQLFPAGVTVGGITYPQGGNETVITHTDDLFARMQLTWRPAGGTNLLVGAEYSALLYHGDDRHTADIDSRAGGDFAPLPREVDAGPYYEPIRDRPIQRVGLYTQLVTGPLLHGLVTLTLGARYDGTHVSYVDVRVPERPDRTLEYDQISPRAALVLTPTDRFSLKVLGAQAFRAPVASELFVSNTSIQTSNPDGLAPERLTNAEIAATWLATDHLELRANGYWLWLRNLIGFNEATQLVNLYDREHLGAEAEALFDFDLHSAGRVSGFANGSYVKLVRETVLASSLDPAHRLVWAPAFTAKGGVTYQLGGATLAATLLYQGSVARRTSDLVTPENRLLRPDTLPPWASLDLNATWQLQPWLRLALRVTNALDAGGRIITTGDYPFDGHIEGRRVVGSLILQP